MNPRDPLTRPPPLYDPATAAAIVRWRAQHDRGLLTEGPVLDLVPDGEGGWRKADPDESTPR